jgi:hypothetical protein
MSAINDLKMISNDNQDFNQEDKRTKRNSYDFEMKYKALKLFETNKNVSETARVFKVHRKTINDWRKQEKEIIDNFNSGSKGKKRFKGRGRNLASNDLELRLISWIENERQVEKRRVTRKKIKHKALEIHRELVSENKAKSGFNASDGYVDGFMKRNKLSNRRRTTVSQRCPQDCVQQLVSFVLYVRKLKIENNYKLNNIYACDETSVWFDCVANYTIDKVGTKEVTLKSTGHEKMRISVMLCAKANGFKCKPYVLLERKREMPELISKYKSLVLEFAGKIWMDDNLVEKFLDKIIGTMSFEKRLLVWDAFRAHISASTKTKLRNMKVDAAVVPGGCTPYIQAPDVSWNKPFKDKLKELYDDFLENGEKRLTRNGNPAPPSLDIVCSWIDLAWKQISSDIIVKSFKICSITTNIDGSEDDLIECFKDNKPNSSGREILRLKNHQLQDMNIVSQDDELGIENDSDSEGSDVEVDFDDNIDSI